MIGWPVSVGQPGWTRHPECPDLTLLSVLAEERPHLMPNPQPFDGYIEQPVRASATALIHYQRSRYSVPAELAHQVISLRVYSWEVVLVAEGEEVARHRRCFERYQTVHDWQHYVGVLQRKPGALRNGAPFTEMPNHLKTLQRYLLRHEGGDRVLAQVLGCGRLRRAGACTGGGGTGTGVRQHQR